MRLVELSIRYYPEYDRDGLTLALLGLVVGVSMDRGTRRVNFHAACEWHGFHYWTTAK